MGLALAMMSGSFQGTALNAQAAEQTPMVFTQTFQPDPELFPDSDELFAGYVESVLYEDIYEDVSTFGNMGATRLKGKEKQYFEDIKQKIADVADGKRTSTRMVLDVEFTWTAEELGVDKITYENYGKLVSDKYHEEININRIWNYLLADCPYAMYWYDKTQSSGGLFYTRIAGDGSSATVYDITMNLPVAHEYRDLTVEAEEQAYTFNKELSQSVATAKKNAQEIVDKYKDLSRYEKMKAYSEEILELASYNTPAGNGTITQYGNPWQLIWVFDKDETTEVVCEGYSKSFQYLCDLTGDLTCYSVTGVLSWDYGASGNGAGPHMWNVVTFGGKNYMVDVTNMEHLGEFLFMAGPDRGSAKGGYDFIYKAGVDEYVYTYKYFNEGDDDQFAVYGEEILTLANGSFDPSTIAETVVKFDKTVQNVAYTGAPVEISAPKVTVNGVERADLEVTYGYRDFAEQVAFKEGLPTAVGLYDVQAYVGEEDLRKPGKSNIITVNVVQETPTPEPTVEVKPDDASKDINVALLKATAGNEQVLSGNNKTEGPASFVLDNNTSTLWHTDWNGSNRESHWIQFEISKDYNAKVDGLRYLPRANAGATNAFGVITAYKVLVSNDGTNWKEVASGTWANNASWKAVHFDAQDAKYVRLVSSDSVSDSRIFTSAAEIRLTGSVTEAPKPTVTEAPKPTETATPQPTKAPEVVTTVFTDVYNDWYVNYVQYVYDNALMTGIKGTKQFQPNANITKAQVAQVLYNMENQPMVAEKKVFAELTDVYAAEWYGNAVAWAYETGVVTGDLNTKKFNPNADVTREQLALMMFRYAAFKKYDVSASGNLEELKNAENVNNWAADGVNWAVGSGLISGIEKDGVKDLAPQGNASRAQVAAILQRFCEFYSNVK
jgi:hypothetical protein